MTADLDRQKTRRTAHLERKVLVTLLHVSIVYNSSKRHVIIGFMSLVKKLPTWSCFVWYGPLNKFERVPCIG
jgi:hypothetical protein